MGKSKAAVRAAFEKVAKKVGEKQNKFKCGYCHWLTAENASRMTKHAIKCPSMPENVRRSLVMIPRQSLNESQIIKTEMVSSIDHSSNGMIGKSLNLENSHHSGEGKQFGSAATQYNKSFTEEEQILLAKKLARAIYASGCAFSLVENSHWNDFLKTLSPSFSIPATFDIGNSLLEAEYDEIKHKCSNAIMVTPHVGLQCHEWSNNSGDSMINFIVTTPHPILFKSIPTNTQSYTAKYIANLMLSVIDAIGPHKVTGIVTETTDNMRVTWSLLKAVYPHINIYGCVDHALNLITQDILKIKELARIIDDVRQIVNFVNSEPVNRAALNVKQQDCKESISLIANQSSSMAQMLKLPVKTRLGSTVISLNSILSNATALRDLTTDDDSIESFRTDEGEAVKASILSETFWQEVLHLRNLLEPIYKWMVIMKSDKRQLSYVCKTFEDIAKQVSLAVDSGPWNMQKKLTFCQIISDRSKFCVTSLHKAANLLDPRICGEDINEDDFHEASQFIFDQAHEDDTLNASQVMADLAAYKTKSGSFAPTYLWSAVHQIDPSMWWKAYCSQRQLSKIAIRILDLPPTSSTSSIITCTQDSVQLKSKNQITQEQVSKVAYVRHNLQLMSNESFQEKAAHNMPTESNKEYDTKIDKLWKNFTEAESDPEYIDEEWLEEVVQ